MKRLLILAALAMMLGGEVRAGFIISQYYEGTLSNKWMELTNTGTSSLDLSNYRLGLWSNAAREGWKTGVAPNSFVQLSGSLAAGGVYLARNGSATLPTYATANLTSNGVINFSGDDSVVLYTGSTYSFANVVDVFGLTGNTAADRSYYRNASVLSGVNTDFNSNDWTLVTNAVVDNINVSGSARLGVHEFNAVPEPTTGLLLGVGTLACAAFRRSRRVA
jgi:predicted extracellular nuclease